jgi:dTDP-4-amino-4,6-dideoxygalactose transaminase
MTRLGDEGIETRQWWGQGCHLMPAYAQCAHEPLPVTENLGVHVLGLPMSVDLSASDVNWVCAAVGNVVNG